VCTDGYTNGASAWCEVSNVCSETDVVLADGQGDGWNGATAHIDAYTGYDQWTFVSTTSLVAGEGTSVLAADQTSVVKQAKDVGCLKDGCYAFHFTNIGVFPAEGTQILLPPSCHPRRLRLLTRGLAVVVMILGSNGMTDSKNVILGNDNLKNTNQKFWFKVQNGDASGANETICDPASSEFGIPFVQLGDEATLAPGMARDHDHGELHSDYERH
jgi:hypothetical protein